MNTITKSILFTFTLLIHFNLMASIDVKGKEEFKIFQEKSDWVVSYNGKTLRLLAEKTGWVLKDNMGNSLGSVTNPSPSEVQLFYPLSKIGLHMKCEKDSCRLSKDGKNLLRIKEKPDKTNIYDGNDKRIFKVKTKSDGYSIKSVSSNQLDWKIKGIKNVIEAALFAVPLSLEERLLLWRGYSK